MDRIDAPALFAFFRVASARLDAERQRLCALDGEIGDGDHGTSMANGFAAIETLLRDRDPGTTAPADLLRDAAMRFIGEVGATVGPLYASALLELARVFDRPDLPLRDVLAAMADGIAARGGAVPGDKTMLDVWRPAARAAATDGDAEDVLRAARQGAQATVSMMAGRGRAARLKERSLGHLDPGAASALILVEVLIDAARGRI